MYGCFAQYGIFAVFDYLWQHIFHVWGEKIHIISKGEGNVDYNTIKKGGVHVRKTQKGIGTPPFPLLCWPSIGIKYKNTGKALFQRITYSHISFVLK